MEWSKIKTIILLMLLGVNLFLVILVTGREASSAQYQEAARSDAVALLLAQGIAVDENSLPAEMELSPLTVVRDGWGSVDVPGTLLGELNSGTAGEIYQGSYGTARFSVDGTFSVALSAGAYPLGEASAEEVGEVALSALGFAFELLSWEEGSGVLLAQQLWDGNPIFSAQTSLRFVDDSLRELKGIYVTGEATAQQSQEPLTVATILLEFLAYLQETGTICREIQSVTAGYQLSAAQISPVYLTPTWQIVADGVTYEMDAVTGVVSQVSLAGG